MIEPSLAFQTAVRAALIADPAVTDLVDPKNIRSGGRPDGGSCIILGDAHTQLLGCAAGGQTVARVILTLHVWAIEDGTDSAKNIGWAVIQCLTRPPATGPDIEIDNYEKPQAAWLRDPSPEATWTRGDVELEAILRWRS
jgi:hypothetical protein